MFQDIQPHHYSTEYHARPPKDGDYLLCVHRGNVLMREVAGAAALPRFGELAGRLPESAAPVQYLFSVDGESFFLTFAGMAPPNGWGWHPEQVFRGMMPSWLGFAGATASHLAKWYDTHRYCGRCAAPLVQMEAERALACPACGVVEYPKIAPVVIVGVTCGDELLLTRYASAGYRRHALVAGYVEIGETLEDAVRREVMEEVGLEVDHVRYYKSQPWAFSESVLMGFYARADRSCPIQLDTNELAEAAWFRREDIPKEDNMMSLTWSMIEAFRTGEA